MEHGSSKNSLGIGPGTQQHKESLGPTPSSVTLGKAFHLSDLSFFM